MDGTLGESLHRYPFLRLVFPWMAGIVGADRFFAGCGGEATVEKAVLGLLAFLCIGLYFLRRRRWQWCFGLAVTSVCFAGGWAGMTRHLEQSACSFPETEAVYRVLLTNRLEPKERTYLCRVRLEERYDSASVPPVPVGRNALLYIQRDSVAAALKVGEELWVSARLAAPASGKNFDDFDYARYLMRKGICGTGYVPANKWMAGAGQAKPLSDFSLYLTDRATDCRESVLSLYRRLGFGGDALAVLSALTVGDKTELGEEVRESYSVAGVSHVLALSGLHIGLLYGLFFFLLRPLGRMGGTGTCLRVLILLVLLWGFAFLTGLSPSVVRSAAMFSIVSLASAFRRQSFSLNTLAATAWVMLLFHPVWLFDVGFQLSFLAVASILLFQPCLYRAIPVRSRLGKYVWGLMSVSIAAQLGTAPFVLFYFSRFSTYFLLANLVVVSCVTLVLYAAVCMLLLTPLEEVQSWFASWVRWLLEGLNGFVRWMEQLPYASFDGIYLRTWEVCGLYLALALGLYYIQRRRAKRLAACLAVMLLWCVGHGAGQWADRPEDSLVFYNLRGCPVVHCISASRHSWLAYADTLPDGERLRRVATGYWNRLRLLPPVEVAVDSSVDTVPGFRQGFLSYLGCRVCLVNDNGWRKRCADEPLPVDYLYLCQGYDGKLAELNRLFSPSCIVLDASLSEYRRRRLEAECREADVPFVSLPETGAVCVPLSYAAGE